MKETVYFIAELLGVKTFKRYWPVGGSFWNDTHIRKDSKTDLERTLREVKGYTRQHVQISFLVTAIYLLGWLADVSTIDFKYYFYVFVPMELYPFMVQLYNYFKLHDQLDELNKGSETFYQVGTEEGPILIKEFGNDDLSCFYGSSGPTSRYRAPTAYMCEMYGSRCRSKLFHTRAEAEAYRNHIYDTYGNDFVILYNTLTSDLMKSQ